MELRPFRSLRFSPSVITRRGLAALIAPPASRVRLDLLGRLRAAAPENLVQIISPSSESGDPGTAAAQTLGLWLSEGILLKERGPGLWIYRQSSEREGRPLVRSMLVGLVRLGEAAVELELSSEAEDPNIQEECLALRRATKADFELVLLRTRAPLAGALATTRRPELSAVDPRGVRHDGWRVNDFAQHVELQGLVKNADSVLAAGRELWEAAREFAGDPNAAKLPGAKFKLCAILDEQDRKEVETPVVYSGLFGVSLEDPVY